MMRWTQESLLKVRSIVYVAAVLVFDLLKEGATDVEPQADSFVLVGVVAPHHGA